MSFRPTIGGARCTLRPATDGDRSFFWQVHHTALRAPVEATWGWDDTFQERYFNESFSTSDHSVVIVDGVAAGFICVIPQHDYLYLAKIALLPDYQGKGLGTELVRTVLDQARRLGLPVRLQVLKANRARALYERLGFTEWGETNTHYLMVWRAVEQSDEAGGRLAEPNAPE